MKITPVLAFKDNYIWMLCANESKKIWVVDPGDAHPVLEYLKNSDFDLAGILLTHHHHDHSGGISKLLEYATHIPVYGSQQSPHEFITHRLNDNEEIICGSTRFRVLAIPGHTLDHIAFFDGENLFCGDTLFSAGCGKVFEGTYEEMYQSLEKLRSLSDATKIFCGHEYTLSNLQFAQKVEPNNPFISKKIGETQTKINAKTPTLPSILKDEKNINPFLRCQEQEVIKAAENHAHKNLANPVEVFTCLRQWKNAQS